MTVTNPKVLLEKFKELLLQEKEALIQNHGEAIQHLVTEKQLFSEQLQEIELTDKERNELTSLVAEIRNLQETNLLLTQQSLEFVGKFLESIQKETQKQSMTYSKKGAYQSSPNTAFLDQSL